MGVFRIIVEIRRRADICAVRVAQILVGGDNQRVISMPERAKIKVNIICFSLLLILVRL